MLLIRLAAQNLGRRRLRALLLGLSVALAVGVGVAGLVAGRALSEGIAASFSRMGADLVVVPRSTLVNITASLLTVQPTDEMLDVAVVPRIAGIDGVARAAPQRQVKVAIEGRSFNLIAFDPATDFTIQTWARDERPASMGVTELLAGARVPGKTGETLSVCRRPMDIHGRLARTGVGPVDDSYFVTFDGLDFLAALCRQDTELNKGEHAAMCLPDYTPGKVSAVLLQLAPNARAEQVKFAISQIAGVKVVEGNALLTSSRQALRSLLVGVAVFAAAGALAILILVSLLFSAIVQERLREIGLLRAMGARPNHVVAMVLAEAGMITGLGGLGGIVLGFVLLFASARSLGFYFERLGVPFGWPPVETLATISAAVLAASAALGVAGALYPAWRVRRLEPFALIHGEAR
ncbi:MAG TPA: ABC transporter permease [Reyranella sp.]